ncbi:hypothetical protein GO013_16470 [Pseudodesulfovibrio sp. JC047]|uniref:hypothetical protein n=1 Tax=Pseudodesulfovibrio sp. JC047 TaxID=2683199 RepID=UPI0013CFF50F|nr:hypothetical protein [Pseudodesulfovibrio sp. JC047]NDV21007.1 hypothetical protein [Pseudodesulfovibrio sp. JC047]
MGQHFLGSLTSMCHPVKIQSILLPNDVQIIRAEMVKCRIHKCIECRIITHQPTQSMMHTQFMKSG